MTLNPEMLLKQLLLYKHDLEDMDKVDYFNMNSTRV